MRKLEDIMRIQERKKKLSKMYDDKVLVFNEYRDGRTSCDVCYEESEQVIPDVGLPYMTAVHLVKIDGRSMCRNCFVREYHVGRHVAAGQGRAMNGRHGSIPNSQRNYDGDNFYSGEW